MLNVFSMKNLQPHSAICCEAASALSSAETVQSGTVITSSVSQLVPNDSPLVLGNYRSPDGNVVTKASLLHFGKKVKIQIFTVRSCRDIIILSQTQMYIYQKSKHIVSFKILLHCVQLDQGCQILEIVSAQNPPRGNEIDPIFPRIQSQLDSLLDSHKKA